jgi:acetyltransferase-like isoleucine patch superfamily enzyme
MKREVCGVTDISRPQFHAFRYWFRDSWLPTSFKASNSKRSKNLIAFTMPFGIVVCTCAIIGEEVVIGHQVTIGNRNGVMAAPKIGNRVYIGAGAKILGPVTIGDDAIVGANAVVTKDVPARATVVGANRILKQ